LALAQDSSSCVVDSMPRSAIERGHVNRVLDLQSLPNFLYAQCAGEPSEIAQQKGSVVQTH
ncbi:MAG: chemotaxis protein CheB, partial [Candidatus Acidiferrales bacterium]